MVTAALAVATNIIEQSNEMKKTNTQLPPLLQIKKKMIKVRLKYILILYKTDKKNYFILNSYFLLPRR